MPILLGLMLQERQILTNVFLTEHDGDAYRFSGWQTAITATLLVIVLEELLPMLCDGYTRDTWDYLAYGLGSVAFHFVVNGGQSIEQETEQVDT